MRIPNWVYSADIRRDIFLSYEGMNSGELIFPQERTGCFPLIQAKNSGFFSVRVAAADKPDTLVRCVEGYRPWPCTFPPKHSHDINPKVV